MKYHFTLRYCAPAAARPPQAAAVGRLPAVPPADRRHGPHGPHGPYGPHGPMGVNQNIQGKVP